LIPLASANVAAAQPLPQDARATLEKATAFMRSIATEGGYLWWYSEDLNERWGENKATPTQIWIQPAGTPSMGMAFLRAYEVTREARYLEAAQAAALALAGGQLESGGWDYLIDFDPQKATQYFRRQDKGKISDAEAAQRKNITTFDDDNTQSAVRFLMAFVKTSSDKLSPEQLAIREALDYALIKMVEAQYPNGAWPQRYDGKPRDRSKFPVQRARIPENYPREHPKQNYMSYYTLNDHTQSDCIRTMLEAHQQFGKREYLEAAKKGGDFLILAQLPAPQSAWAQQYNFDMEPVWARAFEPPAVCSGESVGAIRILIQLHRETGDDKFLKPISAAIDWFKRSQLRPNTWARFYELGSNKPIYGDRDGKIHYRLDEISEERRRGYSWESSYRIPETIADFEELRPVGREAVLQKRRQGNARMKERLDSLTGQTRRIVDSLDAKGRWIVNGRIQTRVFIRNVETLCDYLEASEKAEKER
jgi:hypothetical protein